MIWFDLDNSPHVPLFRPVLRELEQRGVPADVTARDFAQTASLLKYWNIPHTMIGAHGGKNKIKKVLNLMHRSQQLRRYLRGRKTELAVSHGSRTQVVAAYRAGIPSVLMLDYEHTEATIFNLFSTYLLMPEYIPDDLLRKLGFNMRKLVRYPGFKEEIYLQDFAPDAGFRRQTGVDEGKILVTVRPPSVVGNYHDGRSETLLVGLLDRLSAASNVHILLVSRTKEDVALIPAHLWDRGNITLLTTAVDGLQLLWHSDIVVSGGGTMNRESALMGVPTYSIFTGNKPYLDHVLEEQGRITFIEGPQDIDAIPIVPRDRPLSFRTASHSLAAHVTDMLLDFAKKRV